MQSYNCCGSHVQVVVKLVSILAACSAIMTLISLSPSHTPCSPLLYFYAVTKAGGFHLLHLHISNEDFTFTIFCNWTLPAHPILYLIISWFYNILAAPLGFFHLSYAVIVFYSCKGKFILMKECKKLLSGTTDANIGRCLHYVSSTCFWFAMTPSCRWTTTNQFLGIKPATTVQVHLGIRLMSL